MASVPLCCLLAVAAPLASSRRSRPHLRSDPAFLSRCPTTLNTSSWFESRRSAPQVSYRDARPADMVVGRQGALIGQDSNLKWWPIVVRSLNADGRTWVVDVQDGAGEQWERVWVNYVKVKEVRQPASPLETVRVSACANFDARCAPRLSAAALAGADEPCVASLKPAVWAGLSAEQTRALAPAAVAAIPASSCEAMDGDAAAGLSCERQFSAECAAAFAEEALEMMQPACVSQLPSAAFKYYAAEQMSAVMKGAGGRGLRAEQAAELSTDGCDAVAADFGAVRDLGEQGAMLCLAMPKQCWNAVLGRPGQVQLEDIPTACLTQLPDDVFNRLATPTNFHNAEGQTWCSHGAQALAGMSAQKRGVVPRSACAECLLQGAAADAFPQCEGVPHGLSAKLLGFEDVTTAQWAMLAVASAIAFMCGMAMHRRRYNDVDPHEDL